MLSSVELMDDSSADGTNSEVEIEAVIAAVDVTRDRPLQTERNNLQVSLCLNIILNLFQKEKMG